jgi:hypothetical protein
VLPQQREHPRFQPFHAACQLRRGLLGDLHVLLEHGQQSRLVWVLQQQRGQGGLQHLHLRRQRQLVVHQAADVVAVQRQRFFEFALFHGHLSVSPPAGASWVCNRNIGSRRTPSSGACAQRKRNGHAR